eukprot:TRINITY_DN1269_c0_g1_i2.p1 TRINITY_DN1269_c0_g1~~TRINITY_DN1269_c0_g1_i2.p1  ORF type:complete len:228 (-),score=48.40 TRINITY_DN1269_c0_g1_i2:28-711(-)
MVDRRSVWDLVHSASESKSQPANRLFFVAYFTANLVNKKDLSKDYDQLWSRYSPDTYGPVTGLSLALPQSTLCVIEAHRKVLWDFARELATAPDSKLLLRDARILSFSEDCPHRVFPQWDTRVLNFGTTLEMEGLGSPQENHQKLVNRTVRNLLRLGGILSDLHRSDVDEYELALDNVRSRYKDMLPTVEEVTSLLKCPQLFPLCDFFTLYNKPVSINLETELVWTQ